LNLNNIDILSPNAMPMSPAAIPGLAADPYYARHTRGMNKQMKTSHMNTDTLTVELTEFEVTALVALVERGMTGIEPLQNSEACIRKTILGVAREFNSMLGHFELTH